jgi:hypothetical protein
VIELEAAIAQKFFCFFSDTPVAFAQRAIAEANGPTAAVEGKCRFLGGHLCFVQKTKKTSILPHD